MGVENIFKRAIRRFGFGKLPDPDYMTLLKENNLKTGKDCELSNFHVIIHDRKAGIPYIEIGDNCCIRGTVIIYKPTARLIIGNNVYIGPGTILEIVEEITIKDDVLVSMFVNLTDSDSHSLHSSDRKNDTVDWQKGVMYKNWDVVACKKIIVESKSWIGLRCIILKGVVLGEGTIVAAGAVVTKSTDPFTLVGGNPAKFIKAVD